MASGLIGKMAKVIKKKPTKKTRKAKMQVKQDEQGITGIPMKKGPVKKLRGKRRKSGELEPSPGRKMNKAAKKEHLLDLEHSRRVHKK